MSSPPTKRPRPNPSEVSFSLAHARSKTALLFNPLQQRNPLLKHIRHVRIEVSPHLQCDFLPSPTTAVLFLSLQYHLLHPRYIYTRLPSLTRFRLRVLLVLADIPAHEEPLHELMRLGVVRGLTVVVAGGGREAARYLEGMRSYSERGGEGIRERVEGDYASRVKGVWGSVRGINRTDVGMLVGKFGKVRNLAEAPEKELRACPGLGERKVKRLWWALHAPFKKEEEWEEGENS